MDIFEAMEARHSVRQYTDRALEPEKVAALTAEVDACNAESGLHIQLVTDEPEAFSGFKAHYGRFSGVRNYIALVGQKSEARLDEKAGYYGQRLALVAQMLGLNTCWVASTYSKSKSRIDMGPDEKVVCVIALGYGEDQGSPHTNRPMEALCETNMDMPDWFRRGMEAALLAPTAVNQQKFLFILSDGKVKARSTGGFYSKVDLGIVKYHFEIGAGRENFQWAE